MIFILQIKKDNIRNIKIPKRQYLNWAISECFDYWWNYFYKINSNWVLAARQINKYGSNKSKYDFELIVEFNEDWNNLSNTFVIQEIFWSDDIHFKYFKFESRIIL